MTDYKKLWRKAKDENLNLWNENERLRSLNYVLEKMMEDKNEQTINEPIKGIKKVRPNKPSPQPSDNKGTPARGKRNTPENN